MQGAVQIFKVRLGFLTQNEDKMYKKQFSQFIIILIYFIGLYGQILPQASITSAASGAWSSTSTWTGGVVPTSLDNVTIASAHTVTLDANAACNNLTLLGNSSGTRIALSTFILEVYGTINGDGTSNSASLITSDFPGRIKFIGNSRALFGDNWAANPPTLSLEVALNAGQTGTSSKGVKAKFIQISSGTFDLGTQELRPDSGFANSGVLIIEDGGVLKCLRLSRTGTANIPFGSMVMNGTSKFQPNSTGATTNYLPAVSGGFPVYTFSNTSIIEYVGSSSGTISVVPYKNLYITLANSGGSRTFAAGTTVDGDLVITSATVSASSGTITINGNVTVNNDAVFTAGSSTVVYNFPGASNTLTVNNNGIVETVNRNTSGTPPAAGTTTPFSTQFSGIENLILNTGSTVSYAVPGGTTMGTQDIQTTYGSNPIAYKNLRVRLTASAVSQSGTWYIPEGVSVENMLTVTTTCTSATNIQTVHFNNTSPITVGALTISRTAATAGATVQNINFGAQTYNITGSTTLTNGGIRFTSNSTTVNFNGAVTTGGTRTDGPIFNFNGFAPTINFNSNFTDGASATTFSVTGTEVPVINFNNGTSGSKMTTSSALLRGSVTVNGYRQVTGSNFRVENASTADYGLNIAGTLELQGNSSTGTNSGGGTNVFSGSGTLAFTGSYSSQISGYSSNTFNGTGTLAFSGSSAQMIGAGSYGSFIIANSAGVSLTGDVSLAGNLTLNSGLLTLGSNNLTLTDPGQVLNYNSSRYVVTDGAGLLKMTIPAATSTTFPVGFSNSLYNPVTITNAVSKEFSVRAKNGTTNPVVSASHLPVFWDITPTGSEGLNASLTVQWSSSQETQPGFNRNNNLQIARWSVPTSSWVPYNATLGGSDPYTATASGISSFSEFGLSTEGALPVELTSFTARAQGTSVTLNWETKTEIDNNGFEVERNASGTWQKIGFVEGHGTANSPKYYSFSDANPLGNKIQYRLKQIDNDGDFEYSDVVEVELAPVTYTLYQNYPNPFNPSTVIRYALPAAGMVTIDVFNALGEKVATLLNGEVEAGYNQVSFDATNLPSGLYFYRIQSGDFTSIKKMLLMK